LIKQRDNKADLGYGKARSPDASERLIAAERQPTLGRINVVKVSGFPKKTLEMGGLI